MVRYSEAQDAYGPGGEGFRPHVTEQTIRLYPTIRRTLLPRVTL